MRKINYLVNKTKGSANGESDADVLDKPKMLADACIPEERIQTSSEHHEGHTATMELHRTPPDPAGMYWASAAIALPAATASLDISYAPRTREPKSFSGLWVEITRSGSEHGLRCPNPTH